MHIQLGTKIFITFLQWKCYKKVRKKADNEALIAKSYVIKYIWIRVKQNAAHILSMNFQASKNSHRKYKLRLNFKLKGIRGLRNSEWRDFAEYRTNKLIYR